MKTLDIGELEIRRFVGALIELSTYRQRKNAQGRVTQSSDPSYARGGRRIHVQGSLGYSLYFLNNTKNFISQELSLNSIILLFIERIFAFY